MPDLLTEDPHMLDQIRFAQVLASRDDPVLVTGESGTGKEEMANILHGNRRQNQTATNRHRHGDNFVPVNVTTLQPELFESQMFGHAQGAFTGATRDTTGLVQQADGGTLFLDEIGELPLPLQPKLLRFIQHKKFRKIGSTRLTPANCRLVFSTNKDLRVEVKEKRFRLDLFHRISVFIVQTTPLRERPDDITLYLTETGFDKKEAKDLTNKITNLTELSGNYRELQSIIARYKVLGELIIYQ